MSSNPNNPSDKNKSKHVLSGLKTIVNRLINPIANVFDVVFKKKLSRNTGSKLLSLTLAVLFWFFVMDQVDPEITRIFDSIPVQLTNTQELDQNNLKIMNQTDFFVSVEVTGRRNNVLSLNSKSIYLWADMRSARSGVNNIFINSTINSDSVSIKEVLPKEIVLTVDRIVALPKPVKIMITDSFQESLYQESMSINPLEIKVSGPESLVNSVSYLGGTISVNTLTGHHSREVSLVPYSFDGEIVSGVSLEMSYATVSLTIGKQKEVPIKALVEGEPMTGYRVVGVNVSPSNVILTGQIDRIDLLNSISVETITLDGTEDTTLIIERDLVLPEQVSTLSENVPIQIEVLIEEIISKEFTFDINELAIVNLEEGFITNLNEQEALITVKVTGIESVISLISKNDIRLDLNFSNVTAPGIYRLKINSVGIEDFDELVIDPLYIEATVVESSTVETTSESTETP